MDTLSPYDFIIFDLDGTLYDEQLYLNAAYKTIAAYLSERHHLDMTELEDFLISGFESGGRSGLFDRLCSRFEIPESEISDMLILMRTVDVDGTLDLYPQMQELLRSLIAAHKPVFIITNGTAEQQQNKVKSINWQGLDQHIEIVFANTIQPKPDRAAFDYLVEKFNLVPNKTVFIGDTQTDIDFAKNAGIDFIHAHDILGI